LKNGVLRGVIKVNDPIVIVTGWQQGSGFTNTLRIIFAPQLTEKELQE
jgi:pyruvate kinase